jgi:hypothetical protein
VADLGIRRYSVVRLREMEATFTEWLARHEGDMSIDDCELQQLDGLLR